MSGASDCRPLIATLDQQLCIRRDDDLPCRPAADHTPRPPLRQESFQQIGNLRSRQWCSETQVSACTEPQLANLRLRRASDVEAADRVIGGIGKHEHLFAASKYFPRDLDVGGDVP